VPLTLMPHELQLSRMELGLQRAAGHPWLQRL